MEINIQIKNVQKPEDIANAFAALGQSNNRPPLRRGRRDAAATTAATRRSPSLILTPQELEALQQSHPQGAQNLLSSTDAEASAGEWSEDEGATLFCVSATTDFPKAIPLQTIVQSTITQSTIFQSTIFQGTISQGIQGTFTAYSQTRGQ
ncbi:unnamed protein product [Symbiodinium microadriaticum]|nr:unnamed protein product [Symbiodinium microadriaticum]